MLVYIPHTAPAEQHDACRIYYIYAEYDMYIQKNNIKPYRRAYPTPLTSCPINMYNAPHTQVSIGGLEHALTPLAAANPLVHVFDRPTLYKHALWLPYRRAHGDLTAAVNAAMQVTGGALVCSDGGDGGGGSGGGGGGGNGGVTGPLSAIFAHADIVGASMNSTYQVGVGVFLLGGCFFICKYMCMRTTMHNADPQPRALSLTHTQTPSQPHTTGKGGSPPHPLPPRHPRVDWPLPHTTHSTRHLYMLRGVPLSGVQVRSWATETPTGVGISWKWGWSWCCGWCWCT